MAKVMEKKNAPAVVRDGKQIEWIDIGVGGLLDFIPGLPKGDAILVRGEPGTGKTILALQFLHKGAENGEKCVYITTEETPETIMRTGSELWPDFQKLVESKRTADEQTKLAKEQTAQNEDQQKKLAEANGGNYAYALALVAGIVAIALIAIIRFSPEKRGETLYAH